MSTVLAVDFSARKLVSRIADAFSPLPPAPPEARDEIVRREVLRRCKALDVPVALAMYQASLAAQTVRAGHEPSSAAERAVQRALDACKPTTPPPLGAA